ncbi:glycoside hydrolase family 13 protein [Friedmanniella luteola]|uniref:glycoside hydrolase family 13 protein n=1 Tax=Friedmanniella luteola TaxID=546871 RepID=UPI000B80783F|nr:glycoside hydrolase family 13 protein [Friedmanniella luteola]
MTAANSAPTSHDRDWWRQAVVYQVYPRSFADSNGDGIGDLPGLTSRMDYLADLGVDAVWLSPFYPSALADGGYDVADYRDVAPELGTLADFDALVAAAKARGLKVVVDIVPNHTSDLHVWFQEALASPPGSAARARYIFRDGLGPDGAEPPSDWISHFGGPAWTRVPDGQWYCHLFAPEQPDLDWGNPEVHEDFLTTLRFWADRGVDGYRVDVAHALAKDLSEPLRSKPTLEDEGVPLDGTDPLYDRDEVHEIYAEWRREVFDRYDPPRTAVAEAFAPSERRALYARPTELGQAFNFDLLKADFGAEDFRTVIDFCLGEAERAGSSTTWVLSNHDVVRHATRYGLPRGVDLDAWLMGEGQVPPLDEAQGLRRARAATLLMLALPGSSYLYQGEELGLHEVADIPLGALQDPIWLRTLNTKKGRDGARVPLPWSDEGASYGFGSGAAWLPQPAAFSRTAVSAQRGAAGSTLELYTQALRLRRTLQGPESLTWLPAGDEVLHLERPGGWHCVMNFGSDPAPLPEGQLLLSSAAAPVVDQLPGETTVWLTRPRPA